MFRILATVVTSSVVLMGLALPAGASTAQATSIESFASSVLTVAYQQPVTFTGELVAAAAQTPVPDEPVQIEFEPAGLGVFAPVATGTTGSDGQFTITTTLPSGGSAKAVFAGDTGLMPTSSNPGWGILLQAAHLTSRLVLDPVPSAVPAGTPVTFSGTMQVQVNGTWQPFAGIPLTLTMEPYTSTQPNIRYATTSGSDGRFSLTETVSETSAWSVDTSQNNGYWTAWFPDYASASYNWIDGVSKTIVTSFSLPAKDEAHAAYYNGMYASGAVERWNGSSWVGLAYGWVQLYYRPKGSTTWHKDNGGGTDAYGGFSVRAGVHLGTADWQVRVLPSADTLTSTSTNTVTNTMTDRTHFASGSIQRLASGSQIIGQVTDWYTGQVSFSSLRGRTVSLYYRPTNSATWHYYKSMTVGSNGWVYFSEAKSHGYYFKVVFPAQGPFQSCTSRTL
jgi:hypothetical protein